MKKVITSVLILATMGLMAYRLYTNKEKNAADIAVVAVRETAVAVRVSTLTKDAQKESFSANGTFAAHQDLNVAAEMGGQVVKILVKEGDVVKPGQVLAHIKADRVNVNLTNARAVLENAENEVKRFESAFKTGGVTQQQLEQIRLQFKNAQANYNAAQISSTDTTIKSKIAGIVTTKNIEEGSFVGAGQTLFNIVNISNLKLQVTVDETQVSKIKVGQGVAVELSNLKEKIQGKVSFVAPKSNGALKFPVEVLVENKNNRLKAGMYATANFQEGNAVETLVAPRTAFVGSVSQGKIFKVEDNTAKLVEVKTGVNYGNVVEITQGLKEGDVVVVSGQINLIDGTPVKITE